MARFLDARIPVELSDSGPADNETALLVETGAGPSPGRSGAEFSLPADIAAHGSGCACCVPLGAVAAAMNALFLARARGEIAFFRRVRAVTGARGRAALLAALADDPLVSARFRLDQEGSVVSPAPSARCM